MLYEVGTDRPSGEAVVEFRNRADFHAAMQKHRMYMGNFLFIVDFCNKMTNKNFESTRSNKKLSENFGFWKFEQQLDKFTILKTRIKLQVNSEIRIFLHA